MHPRGILDSVSSPVLYWLHPINFIKKRVDILDELKRIRDLARETRDFALSPEMERRRRLWTDHNSLFFTRPPIYIRAIPLWEYQKEWPLQCADPYLRKLESQLLLNRYRMQLEEDTVIEPFLTVRAQVDIAPLGVYGLPAVMEKKASGIEAARFQPSILEEDDIKKLFVLPYRVDEEETARRKERMEDVLDGILPVAVDRQAPLLTIWNNDISTLLAKLRGLEQIMWDVFDRPEWLHSLVSWMSSQILQQMDETEQAGGFRLNNHQNQAMCYCRELPPPSADDAPVSPGQLWGYMASQEFTTFGPDMFEEFMFRYQKPILERFGLVSYGCCEDLTQKIGVLRSLKNLRRIAVSPFADASKCAEQIGGDYVLSWRPNPSSACSYGVDEDFIRRELNTAADHFDRCGCVWDVTLKDLETTGSDPTAIVRWTKIVREELEKRYG